MNKVELLDCTLRDGGHLLDWKFSEKRIANIIQKLVDAKLDFVEIGFLRDVEYDCNRSLFSKVEQANSLIEHFDTKSEFTLMVRPDWINIESLPEASGISSIRFAFYEKDFELVKRQMDIARRANYQVFLNPINILSYSEDSLKNMLVKINELDPAGVAIVDTFGALLPQDLKDFIPVFDTLLNNRIKLGIHLHENLSLSFSLALLFLNEVSDDRDVVIDASVLGIGRDPGNLPTELIAPYLNKYHSKVYGLKPILECLEQEVQPIKQNESWGYSPEYALSGINQVHRSYPEYLRQLGCDLSTINLVIQEIRKNGSHNKFDKNYANQILRDLND